MISGGAVRPEPAAAAFACRNFSGDYRVEGTDRPRAATPNRVATAAALPYRPLRFGETPPLGGKVAPRQGASVRMSSSDATGGPRKPPGVSHYPVQMRPHPVERLGYRSGVA
jgi:hypothetical protein